MAGAPLSLLCSTRATPDLVGARAACPTWTQWSRSILAYRVCAEGWAPCARAACPTRTRCSRTILATYRVCAEGRAPCARAACPTWTRCSRRRCGCTRRRPPSSGRPRARWTWAAAACRPASGWRSPRTACTATPPTGRRGPDLTLHSSLGLFPLEPVCPRAPCGRAPAAGCVTGCGPCLRMDCHATRMSFESGALPGRPTFSCVGWMAVMSRVPDKHISVIFVDIKNCRSRRRCRTPLPVLGLARSQQVLRRYLR